MDCLEYLDRKSIKINELNKKTISHLENGRFSIIMNSEETDLCRSYALYLLYWITRDENKDKNVYIISHNYHQALLIRKELLELSKRIYLPIEIESEKYVAEVQNYVFINFYRQLFPSISSIKDSKLIINSQPNGFNLFHKIFTDAERPVGDSHKNIFNPLRLYYWEDNKKDGNWVRDKINAIGEELFNRRYNLLFTAVKGERKEIKI